MRKTKQITITIPADVYEKLVARANAENRTLSNLISMILSNVL